MANMTNIDSICVDVRQYGRRGEKRLFWLVLSSFCMFAFKFESRLFRNATVCGYTGPACYSYGFLKYFQKENVV